MMQGLLMATIMIIFNMIVCLLMLVKAGKEQVVSAVFNSLDSFINLS
jgi:hypothetical protein